MCIGSNWVNHAQDLMSVTKFEDFPNSLIPSVPLCGLWRVEAVLTPTFVTLFGPFYTLKYRNITGSTYYGETSTFVVTCDKKFCRLTLLKVHFCHHVTAINIKACHLLQNLVSLSVRIRNTPESQGKYEA